MEGGEGGNLVGDKVYTGGWGGGENETKVCAR